MSSTRGRSWLARIGTLALIVPGSVIQVILALTIAGHIPIMPEPGGIPDPTGLARLASVAVLAGLIALWLSVLADACARVMTDHRTIVAGAIALGAAGLVICMLSLMAIDGFPSAWTILTSPTMVLSMPLLIVSAIQIRRLLRESWQAFEMGGNACD